jgi:hypothetical protein
MMTSFAVPFLHLGQWKFNLKAHENSFVTIELMAVKSNPAGDNGKN